MLEKLQKYTIPEESRYNHDTLVSEDYYQNLVIQRNEEGVQEQNLVRKGMVLNNTEVRNWPTSDVSYLEANDVEFDFHSESLMKTNEKVVVLHTSKNQEWFYVQSYCYMGWVAASDVAFCDDAQWKKQEQQQDWLVVTGNRILLDVNNVNTAVSRKELTMGTKLMLVEDKLESVDGISTINCYVVLMPTKAEDGTLQLVETRVPKSVDVSRGFLDYTPRNIIEQSFKLLGERYGWGGSFNARDCSSYILDVYQCFGINLPRNSSSQAMVPGNLLDVSKKSDEEKQKILLQQSAGTLIEFDGHIMMYLGEYEGKPYAIHQVYVFTPEGKKDRATVASVVVSSLEVMRGNGNTFLNETRYINSIQ